MREPIKGMSPLEIGKVVHARRTALGLSQARLALLSGLSRATISRLERGAVIDIKTGLDDAKLMALLDLVGKRLIAGASKGPHHALQSLCQTASVSYKTVLDAATLDKALVDGQLPANITPHVATLLDEAPLPLIVAAVEEVASQARVSPKLLWKHLIAWAQTLQSTREVWA
jgi:transcriptional regulator with XRE-family HTH domain